MTNTVCRVCGHADMVHAVKDVVLPQGFDIVTLPAVAGMHCPDCAEVYPDTIQPFSLSALTPEEAAMLPPRSPEEVTRQAALLARAQKVATTIGTDAALVAALLARENSASCQS